MNHIDSSMQSPSDTAPPLAGANWIGAALMVAAAALLGALSLAAFCHAWGLNFQDEGWTGSGDVDSQANQPWLIVAILGTIAATFLFWIGLIRLTRHHRI